MYIQFYKNLYSGYINASVDSWDFVIDAIKNPQDKYTDRELIPLWSFYNPIDNPDLDKNYEPRGCSDNMRQFNALQIDFDDNIVRIEDFCSLYKDITFYLYTSFRHSENHHKFRVIIPLDAAYGNKLLTCPANKELLLSKFDGCDKSTINSFRKQRIPALDPINRSAYRFVINDGNRLALPFNDLVNNYNEYIKQTNTKHDTVIEESTDVLDDWYYEIKGLYVPRPNDVKLNTRKSVINDMNKLPWTNRGNGIVNRTLCILYGKLKTAGYSSYEAETIMLNEAPFDAVKEIMGICKMK